jgi:hypothetical protein
MSNDYIKSGDATFSVTDASQFAPGDNVGIYGLNGSMRGTFTVNEVHTERQTVKELPHWRRWLAIVRHPLLWMRFRRDPVGYYVWLARKVLGREKQRGYSSFLKAPRTRSR